MSKYLFPVPKISEHFIDDCVRKLGWSRYTDIAQVQSGRGNVDYVYHNSLIELKILEEEAFEKKARQDKLAALYQSVGAGSDEIDFDFNTAPDEIKLELEKLASKPIHGHIRKASKQIKHSREDLAMHECESVLLIVNNGYNYLDAENFEKLVVKYATKDSSQIDHVFIITLDHHSNGFNTFVFCKPAYFLIRSEETWCQEFVLREAIMSKFNDAMTIMMRDQMNPKLWSESLSPVTDIIFGRDGVKYIYEAPKVPDERFNK